MDIYSNHLVSFNAGVWARAHKFNSTAVSMTRSLQSIAKLNAELRSVELLIEIEHQKLRALVAQAEQKQKEQDDH